jgi:predicted nicotinamide N-methyase
MDATGRYQWPAGARLARDLNAVIACNGQAVCDLGCGRGAIGVAALAAGASDAAFADGDPEALAEARAAVAAAGCTERATFHLHRWGEAIPRGPYRIILGGDILYRPASFAELMDTIALSLANDGTCFLSDPRATLEDELPLLAEARAMTWRVERRSDYSLVRLTPSC